MLLADLLSSSLAWNPESGDSVLLGAVEADLPVVEAITATLPAKARGRVFIEVENADAIRELPAPGRVCVTWLLRERGQSLQTAVDAWLAEMLPVEADREHRVYAWISGDDSARVVTSD